MPSPTIIGSTAWARPWVWRGLLVALFAALGFGVGGGAINMDVWMHLRIGREFLSGWAPWDPGSLSVHATNDWLSTQWLSQVALAQVDQWWGRAGMRAWGGLWVLLFALTLYLACRRYVTSGPALALVSLCVLTVVPWFSARPQVFSYLLIVVVLAAWLRTAHDGRVRWWLVPLFWLWTMLHGVWPFGLVVSAAALLGLTLDRRLDGRGVRSGVALLAACTVVTLLTPSGPGLVRAVLLVTDRSRYFGEWGPPAFTEPRMALSVVPLLVCLVLLLRSTRASWLHVLLLLTTAGIGVYAQRMAPLTLALGSLLLAHVWGTRSEGSASPSPEPGAPRHVAPGPFRLDVAAAVTGVVIACALMAFQTRQAPTATLNLAWADASLAQLPAGSTLLTDRAVGARMLVEHPELDVPIHGYLDLMTDAEIEKEYVLEKGEEGWLDSLAWLSPKAALVDKNTVLHYNLTQLLGWQTSGQDDDVALLFPPTSPEATASPR